MPVLALAGGLIGASYPAWLANRKDVIEALAYGDLNVSYVQLLTSLNGQVLAGWG